VRRRRRCFEGSFLSGNAECWGGTLSPQAAEDAEDIEKDGPRGYLTEHQEEFFVFVWFGAESGSERVREGIAKDVHGLVGCVRIFKTKEMTPQRVTEARDPMSVLSMTVNASPDRSAIIDLSGQIRGSTAMPHRSSGDFMRGCQVLTPPQGERRSTELSRDHRQRGSVDNGAPRVKQRRFMGLGKIA